MAVVGGTALEALVRLEGGTSEELTELAEWLNAEEQLRGRVSIVRSSIGETELGSVPQLLTVMLGTGGAGTVLASSVKTWLQTRKTKAKVTVQSGERSVTLDIETVGEVAPLIADILKTDDGD